MALAFSTSSKSSAANPVLNHVLTSLEGVSLHQEKTKRLRTLLQKREGHHLLQMVENGKKFLSDDPKTTLELGFIEQGLNIDLAKGDFENVIGHDLNKINTVINELLKESGVAASQVDAVFFTGGTTRIKKLQETVMSQFSDARVVNGDVFNSVAMGLSIDALNRFA